MYLSSKVNNAWSCSDLHGYLNSWSISGVHGESVNLPTQWQNPFFFHYDKFSYCLHVTLPDMKIENSHFLEIASLHAGNSLWIPLRDHTSKRKAGLFAFFKVYWPFCPLCKMLMVMDAQFSESQLFIPHIII